MEKGEQLRKLVSRGSQEVLVLYVESVALAFILLS